MNKYLLLFSLLFTSIFLFGLNSNEFFSKNSLPNIRLTVTPTPIQPQEADEIILNRKTLYLPCPPGNRPMPDFSCPDTEMKISVSATKPENNQLKYEYTVSGGQIIGEGAKVMWNMTGAQPGTYQIRIDIDDQSKKEQRTETKTITVIDHDCFAMCVCPTLTVEAPQSLTKAGEPMTFTANAAGALPDITYDWKVSAGEIVEGQVTPVIKVATNSKMAGKTIKATVEIGGVCEECPKTASAEVSVATAKSVKINQ